MADKTNPFEQYVFPNAGTNQEFTQVGFAAGLPTRQSITARDLNPVKDVRQGGQGGTKYDVQQSTYPQPTGIALDNQHYVGFYINIRGSSKYKKNFKVTEITATDENRIDRAKLGSRGIPILATAGAFAGAKVAQNITSKLGGDGKVAQTLSAVAGGATGAATALLFDPDTTFRISEAILLAIQEGPKVKYGINYSEESLGALSGMLAGGSSAVDGATMNMAGETIRALMLEVAKIPGEISNQLNLQGAVAAATGTTPNPFREQLFKNVDFRTFQFNYKFAPDSPEEAQIVKNIIDKFKFHMHPEITTGGTFYIYPSEFNIVYYFNNEENPWINKISTCVLEDMSIDYGAGGGYNTFLDGFPTEINMRLTFRELETLTKERVEQGF